MVVKIDILDDVLAEGEERFSVELTAFDLSIILVDSVAEIFIEDDDDGKIKLCSYTEYRHLHFLIPTCSNML